jgi:hypothetical protein
MRPLFDRVERAIHTSVALRRDSEALRNSIELKLHLWRLADRLAAIVGHQPAFVRSDRALARVIAKAEAVATREE